MATELDPSANVTDPVAGPNPQGPVPKAPAPAAPRRRSHPSLTRKNLIGLGLTFALGLMNLPSVLTPTPDGKEGPPMGVLVLGSVCGLVMIIACVAVWRTGGRRAVRLAAGVTILQALSSVPAFFVDIPVGIKVVAAVAVVASFAAVVLMLSPGRGSTRAAL